MKKTNQKNNTIRKVGIYDKSNQLVYTVPQIDSNIYFYENTRALVLINNFQFNIGEQYLFKVYDESVHRGDSYKFKFHLKLFGTVNNEENLLEHRFQTVFYTFSVTNYYYILNNMKKYFS